MDFEKKVFRVDQMTAQPNGGVNGVISLVDDAGDPWAPAFTALAGTVSDATGANLQAILEDLAGRIADLEEPAG